MRFLVLFVLVSQVVMAAPLPQPPTDPQNPGSQVYPYTLMHTTHQIADREVEFFAPMEALAQGKPLPMIIFGHGQALGVDAYEATLEHLAQKGVIVVHPQYDTGFFDQDWHRMGQDYANLASQAMKLHPGAVDPKQIVYAGHSKGGYIALVAAGLPASESDITPAAVVVFEPAGYMEEYLVQIPSSTPVTITHSDADTVINESLASEIYQNLKVNKKQYIHVMSYTQTDTTLSADHFFPLTEQTAFGGHDGISALHYFGTWKWLLGAVGDLEANSDLAGYLYGSHAIETGIVGFSHQVDRNWNQ